MRKQIAAVVTALLLAACATPSQMSADAEVRRLCAIDGGVKVYETVKLPREKSNERGPIDIPFKEYAKTTDEFFYEWEAKDLQKGGTEIRRDRFMIVRRSDSKVLGESVSYGRRGGDLPGPWHPSSFRCPERLKDSPTLFGSVFKKEQ